jgi:hypothetical protein
VKERMDAMSLWVMLVGGVMAAVGAVMKIADVGGLMVIGDRLVTPAGALVAGGLIAQALGAAMTVLKRKPAERADDATPK